MKKTLITLAALAAASVASAATWQEVDADVTAEWKASHDNYARGQYVLSGITIDFAFSADSLANGTSAIVAYVASNYNLDNESQFTYVLNRDSQGAYTMTMGRSNITTDLSKLDFSSSSTSSAITAGSYTITPLATGGATLVGGTINLTQSYDHWVMFDTTAAAGINNLADIEAATSVMLNSDFAPKSGGTPAIPEPTTATLSLLALAGLAARRRRK